MPLKAGLAAVALLLGSTLSAVAQEDAPRHTESVTVTGIKDREEAVTKFVDAMTMPTRAAGKVARWKDGVCPIAVGVRQEIGVFLIRRIMEVAAQVGAPVNNNVPCPPNIEIIFTATPQALLDNIRIMHPVLLGPYDNSAQAERLATMNSAVQALYGTATVDLRGRVVPDAGRKGGVTITMAMPPAGHGGPVGGPPDMVVMNIPDAVATNVTGSRLGDGVSSAITNVVIVADTGKLIDRGVIALGDYMAMLALAQIKPPESCQPLPTILNLMTPGCAQRPTALTSADLAFLRALYKATATATFAGQQREMQYQMNQALGAQ
jgi:hypothetical protein